MKIRLLPFAVVLVFSFSVDGYSQQSAPLPGPNSSPQPVPLSEQAVVLDGNGIAALVGRLRSTTLNGTAEAPVQNVRVVIENRSQTLFEVVSGFVMFYDAEGVRCGEGLFKLNALAIGESAEADAPGIRISCTPGTWRITPRTLLPRAADNVPQVVGKVGAYPPNMNRSQAVSDPHDPLADVPARLSISIDGEEHPVQLNNALKVKVGDRHMTIVIRAAP